MLSYISGNKNPLFMLLFSPDLPWPNKKPETTFQFHPFNPKSQNELHFHKISSSPHTSKFQFDKALEITISKSYASSFIHLHIEK